MKEFIIKKNDAGQRLDRFVSKAAPLLPCSLAHKYIRIKRIKVNGKRAQRDYMLCMDDSVQMYVNDEFFTNLKTESAYFNEKAKSTSAALNIIYEDDNIILIDKKIGDLCHSAGKFDYSSVVARLQAYLLSKGEWTPHKENSFAPALCNRIDRNTSGIVIAAKNAEALRIINEKIKLRQIDKYYLAAVHGVPNPAAGKLEGYLSKDSKKNRVHITVAPRPQAKFASAEYKTIKTAGTLTLLECRLITGRTHQLRAQLASIGHPLLGDIKYGGSKQNASYGETAQALCAYKLKFSFVTGAGPLSYLCEQSFEISDITFAEKYF